MGRPREHSDDALLNAVALTIARVGPARFTLAEVATDAGVSPATLVQRFGSKQEMLRAFARRSAASVNDEFERGARGHDSAIDGLVSSLVAMTRPLASGQRFRNHLAMLQLDLTDPELRAHTRKRGRLLERAIEAQIAVAIDGGELDTPDPARLAHLVNVTFNGSLLTWAMQGRGSLARWVQADLGALLISHLVAD